MQKLRNSNELEGSCLKQCHFGNNAVLVSLLPRFEPCEKNSGILFEADRDALIAGVVEVSADSSHSGFVFRPLSHMLLADVPVIEWLGSR